MKITNKISKRLIAFLFTVSFLLLTANCFSQGGAAINTTGTAADQSAMLDVSSTNSGILIPRMTKLQRSGIYQPAEGLMIYQTDDTIGFWYFNANNWKQIGSGVGNGINAGTVTGNTLYWNGSQWKESSNIYNAGGSVGVGTNNPDISAAVHIGDTTKGTLISRLTTAQRNSIQNPAEGLQIFNTTSKCLEIFEYGIWQKFGCAFNCGIDRLKFIYHGSTVSYGTIVGQNNTCWLDRNLGALGVASAYNDFNAFGDLFQWGRGDDGHQIRNSTTTSILTNNEIPGHSFFITSSSNPFDWQSPQNNNLWQGNENSINNPCPNGWRIPTATELNNERLSWNSNDFNGAFNSPLKWTAAGCRDENGSLAFVNIDGRYYSSNTYGTDANYLVFYNNNAYIWYIHRVCGLSIRCIKD